MADEPRRAGVDWSAASAAAEAGSEIYLLLVAAHLHDSVLQTLALIQRAPASREMVSRIFKELINGGYVSLEAGHWTIRKKLPARW